MSPWDPKTSKREAMCAYQICHAILPAIRNRGDTHLKTNYGLVFIKTLIEPESASTQKHNLHEQHARAFITVVYGGKYRVSGRARSTGDGVSRCDDVSAKEGRVATFRTVGADRWPSLVTLSCPSDGSQTRPRPRVPGYYYN